MIRDSDPILDWHINSRWPNAPALIGPVPGLLTEACADPAWMQFRDNGPLGWEPEPTGFSLHADGYLQQGTSRPWEPVAVADLHGEGIYVYHTGYVAVCKPNGDFSVAKVFTP